MATARNDFSEYDELLKPLGIDSHLLNGLDKEKKQKLDSLLFDLSALTALIGTERSVYAHMNWADILFAEQEIPPEKTFPTKHRYSKNAAQGMDYVMTIVYIGLTTLGFILNLLAYPTINIDTAPISVDPAATGIGSFWNYTDAMGGIVAGIRQCYQGEPAMGVANIVGGLQLTGCTLTTNLAKWTSLIHLSNAAMGALMGFSFAACMFISAAIEFYEAYKANERMKLLENKRGSSITEEEKKLLQKLIYTEKAQCEKHSRSGKSWMACGVAMTAVAVMSYIALSGATFGALPLATLLVSAAAMMTGIFRVWWVNRVDYVDNVKTTLKHEQKENEKNLFNRLENFINENKNIVALQIDVFTSGSFFTKKIVLEKHLRDMLVKDPAQLEKYFELIDQDKSDLQKKTLDYFALAKKR